MDTISETVKHYFTLLFLYWYNLFYVRFGDGNDDEAVIIL